MKSISGHQFFLWLTVVCSCELALAGFDFTGDGYVNWWDFPYFRDCLTGPAPDVGECAVDADHDRDGDVDLKDYSSFVDSLGHAPIPLRDVVGNVITLGSSEPYNGRQTCTGTCHAHDLSVITNGFHFQQGRTAVDGTVVMKDDFYNDGRYWMKSSGRFGTWSQAAAKQLAAKENTSPSQIDQTAFEWIRDCSGCHPGSGMGEFDRDGIPLFNEQTGDLGYQVAGKTDEQASLDGDYAILDKTTGNVDVAPWDITGRSGPDCLYCHRTERTWVNGRDMNNTWRAGILAASIRLTNSMGDPVPAFAAAATAAQGWFTGIEIGTATPKLDINYGIGVLDGSLKVNPSGEVSLSPQSLDAPPADRVCWGCHKDFGVIAGTNWFDTRDIHFRKLTNRNDDSAANDLEDEYAKACNFCHPGGVHHNFAKGNSFQMQFRNELDFVDFRSCRDCHLDNSPVRHPDAPMVPGEVLAHTVPPFETLSCQACHIPYALVPAMIFIDTTGGGYGLTTQYYSADPLNPADPDKSTWYPAFRKKRDTDGVERWFPCNIWISIYWADWNQNGTPEDLSDDLISPLIMWRVNQLTGGQLLPIVTDDNGDGQREINRHEEILAYLQLLKGNDSLGNPVAQRPVLVKGKRIWYEDPSAPGGVNSLEHVGTGIPIEWFPYIWGMDHNVLAKEEAWGYSPPDQPEQGCKQCHRSETMDSPVFDRLILVDPYDPDGNPVYESLREMTSLSPP